MTILISAAFRVAALIREETFIRGRCLFQYRYPKMRLLLEGSAYLRPDADWRKYGIYIYIIYNIYVYVCIFISSVRLLNVQLDDKLNFSLHVSNICKSPANQLSALIRLNNFLCFEGKRVLINSYFVLYYCLLL